MALLFADGFDHYATADITKKWTTLTGSINPSIQPTLGRRGGGCFRASNTNAQGYLAKGLPAPFATGGVGLAVHISTAPGNDQSGAFIQFGEGTITHVIIGVDAAGSLCAYRTTTSNVLGRSAAGVFSFGVFNYVEAKVTIHDSTGAVEIRLNGVTVLTLTNQDTRNAGNATVNLIYVGATQPASFLHVTYIDDVVIWDTTGSTNNNFLGDVRVDTVYPNGAGNYQAFTPSTGSDHAALADETTPNTSDYLTGAAVGDKETLTMGNLSGLGTIFGVQVSNAVLKTDAGSCFVKNKIRSGSTDQNGALFAPSVSQLYSLSIHETDPATSAAWTQSGVNAVEAGMEVVAA